MIAVYKRLNSAGKSEIFTMMEPGFSSNYLLFPLLQCTVGVIAASKSESIYEDGPWCPSKYLFSMVAVYCRDKCCW
jgi:hypothetical protein